MWVVHGVGMHHGRHRSHTATRPAGAIGRGDRVVAVSEVSVDTIRIHGFGVYDHDTTTDHAADDVVALAGALTAADSVAADLRPLVDHLNRHASPEWAERARRRHAEARAAMAARRPHERARALLDVMHRGARVRLDDGRSIDAHGCFVMRAETFARYATGARVVKVGV